MISRLQAFFAALGAVALAIIAAFFAGKRNQKEAQKIKESKEYVKTRKKIDTVQPVDPDSARGRLLDRKSERDL